MQSHKITRNHSQSPLHTHSEKSSDTQTMAITNNHLHPRTSALSHAITHGRTRTFTQSQLATRTSTYNHTPNATHTATRIYSRSQSHRRNLTQSCIIAATITITRTVTQIHIHTHRITLNHNRTITIAITHAITFTMAHSMMIKPYSTITQSHKHKHIQSGTSTHNHTKNHAQQYLSHIHVWQGPQLCNLARSHSTQLRPKKAGTHTHRIRAHTHTFAHTRARRRPRVAFLSFCWLAADSLSPEAKQRAERPRHAAPDCGEPLRPPNGSSALSVAVLRLIIVLLCDKAGYLSGNGLKNRTNIKPFGGVPGFGWHDLQRM